MVCRVRERCANYRRRPVDGQGADEAPNPFRELSNPVIAERLSISENTVKSHVGNILGKLHLADRTQAAV